MIGLHCRLSPNGLAFGSIESSFHKHLLGKTFLQKGDKMTKLRSKTAGQGGHVTLKVGVCECDSLTDFER